MAFELLELACGCCELCLGVAEAASLGGEKKSEAKNRDALQSVAARNHREQKRGVRIEFVKRRIKDVVFLAGPAAGKRASEINDMELKRLALAMPNRTARFAIRRYLIHRKAGRVSSGESVIKR
jgi:hypothetical protein